LESVHFIALIMPRRTPPPPPLTPPPPIVDVTGHCTVQPGFDRSIVSITGPITSPPLIVDVSGHYTVQPGFDRSFVGITESVRHPPPIVDVSGHCTVQPGFDRSLVGMTGSVRPPPPIIDVSGHFTVQPGFDRSLVGITGPVTLTHVDSKSKSARQKSSRSHVDSQGQCTVSGSSPLSLVYFSRSSPVDRRRSRALGGSDGRCPSGLELFSSFPILSLFDFFS